MQLWDLAVVFVTCQEYLTLPESELSRSSARWMVNHSVDADGPFLRVPVAIVPPACRSRFAPGGALSWRIAGKPRDPLKAALRQGTFLDVLQIKAICAARGIPLPETRSVGQGKPLKFDLLKTLIQACFPDEAEEAIEKLVKKQAQNPNSIIPEAEQLGTAEAEGAQAELLIRMTATLSPHEADHFSDIRQQAVEHLHARRERRKTQFKITARRESEQATNAPAAEAPERASASTAPGAAASGHEAEAAASSGARRTQENPARSKTKAPLEFLELLPDVANVYFHWEPQNRRVWVEVRRIMVAFGCRLGLEVLYLLRLQSQQLCASSSKEACPLGTRR